MLKKNLLRDSDDTYRIITVLPNGDLITGTFFKFRKTFQIEYSVGRLPGNNLDYFSA